MVKFLGDRHHLGRNQIAEDLRERLNGKQLREIIEMARKMPKGIPLSAYMYTVLDANNEGIREMRVMSDTSLDAVLEELGFTAEWKARGREEGREEGLQKGREEAVRRLQKYGMDPKQISEALELPLGTVFRYLKAE
jgi:hypothetical protein